MAGLKEDQEGCLVGVLLIGQVASWIGSGYLAWDWLEPDSFWNVVLFILVWGLLAKVFLLVWGGLVLGIGELFN